MDETMIDDCLAAMGRLQQALRQRSSQQITHYQQAYHAAFARLQKELTSEVIPTLDDAFFDRIRVLERQHRRLMRECQQSMIVTHEDISLINEGIAKLVLAKKTISAMDA